VLFGVFFFASRLNGLLGFPPFIDEAFHIHMAERIALTSSPLEQLGEGRQFTAWYYLLFQAYQGAPIWIARAATVIASMLSLGAFLFVARQLGGTSAMILTGILLVFSPFHYFFERLALADSIAGAATACALAFAARLASRTAVIDAVAVGLCCFVAFGAKVNALIFYAIPIIAVITLSPSRDGSPQGRAARKVRWLMIALAVEIGCLVAFALLARWRGLGFYDGLIARGVSAEGGIQALVTQFAASLSDIMTWMTGYFGLIGVALLVIALLAMLITRRCFLLLMLLVSAAVLLVSQRQDTRFWVTPVALWLTIGGVMLAAIAGQRWHSWIVIAVTFASVLTWLPFATTLRFDPLNAPLPIVDYRQYLMTDAAGTGFDRVFAVLESHDVQTLIGVLPNCHALRYSGMTRQLDYAITCPPARPDGQDLQTLTQLLAESRADGMFALLDAVPFVPDSAPGQIIETISIQARDLSRPTLTLYQLTP
jgi:hypothetical protein